MRLIKRVLCADLNRKKHSFNFFFTFISIILLYFCYILFYFLRSFLVLNSIFAWFFVLFSFISPSFVFLFIHSFLYSSFSVIHSLIYCAKEKQSARVPLHWKAHTEREGEKTCKNWCYQVQWSG